MQETKTTREWPIEFDELQIGDRIPVEDIERIYNIKREDPVYRIRQLALVDLIRRRRSDLDPYLRSSGYDVIIMTPEQASQHQERRSDQSLGQFIRAHKRNSAIDSSAFTEHEKSRHERALYRNGRYLSALASTRRDLKLEAVKTSKPALSEGEPSDPNSTSTLQADDVCKPGR